MAHIQQSGVRNRLLKVMTGEDFARLQSHLEPVDLLVDQTLIEANIRTEYLYFLESGLGSITADGTNGRVEIGIIGREGVVGASHVLLGSDRVPYRHFVQMADHALSIRAGDRQRGGGREPDPSQAAPPLRSDRDDPGAPDGDRQRHL